MQGFLKKFKRRIGVGISIKETNKVRFWDKLWRIKGPLDLVPLVRKYQSFVTFGNPSATWNA